MWDGKQEKEREGERARVGEKNSSVDGNFRVTAVSGPGNFPHRLQILFIIIFLFCFIFRIY